MSLSTAAAFAVANWRFEEASGTTRVDAINGYTAIPGFGAAGATTGKFGSGLLLVASNTEFLRVPDNADVSGGATTIMWRFWVKLNSKSNHHEYVTKWGDITQAAGKTNEYAIAYNVSDDRFSITVSPHNVDGSNDAVTATAGGSPSTGTWYLVHTWYIHSTKELGISVNGGTANTKTVSSSDFAAGITNGTNQMLFGTLQTGSGFEANVLHADAVLDDIVILRGYALDATERTADYNGGTGVEFASWTVTATAEKIQFVIVA